MSESTRPRVLRRAAEVPASLIDEVVEDMAVRMDRSPEARQCAGLSFSFAVTDRRLAAARYEIGGTGRVTVTRDDPSPSTFRFAAESDIFDAVLRGHENALGALLRRRIRLHGSFSHLRSLLRMMPSVTRSYVAARQALIERYAGRYEFRF
jgi:putative sterol carrier protein